MYIIKPEPECSVIPNCEKTEYPDNVLYFKYMYCLFLHFPAQVFYLNALILGVTSRCIFAHLRNQNKQRCIEQVIVKSTASHQPMNKSASQSASQPVSP